MDCNNFFVSCERLFRPDLIKKPVAVLSSNDGCVVSRSQEVKDLGIPMGVPYFQIKDLVKKHDITLFSSNFTLYRDLSRRVMYALKQEFDQCEVYSVDEAFFALPELVDVESIRDIRMRILQKTGIPVSFGIGNTKTIAKAASAAAKKGSGVLVYSPETWGEAVKTISCGSIWGIGRQTSRKLTEAGIATVADLLAHDHTYFRNRLGVVGERLYLELSGTPVYEVGEVHESEHESISSTRSFHTPVFDKLVIESALGYHVAHVAEKLRARKVTASQISIIAAPSRFGDYALRKSVASISLTQPTADTTSLLKAAITLLATIYDSEVPYKKAGVTVSGIVPEDTISVQLFSDENDTSNASRKLYDVADALNARHGVGTVRPGIVLHTEKWKEHKQLLSPSYTTNWHEIPRIKAVK